MTVRLTPTESDTPPPPVPSPPQPTVLPVTMPREGPRASAGGVEADPGDTLDTADPGAADPGAADPDTTHGTADTPGTVDRTVLSPAVGPGEPVATGEGRRALREARRQRRRTTWLCAAVVAVCLALTIVVVILARDRPAATPGVLGATAASPSVPASPVPAGGGTVPSPT